jgi:hypothetical protein
VVRPESGVAFVTAPSVAGVGTVKVESDAKRPNNLDGDER